MSVTGKHSLESEIERLKSELASIKQLKDAEIAELHRVEARFASALRSANDGIWDWDLKTDEVYYSPRWKAMLGFQEDELDNTLNTWALLVHPDERDGALKLAQDYLAGISSAFEAEMRMKHKDGRFIFVRSRAFAIRDDETDEPIRLIGTHVDITDTKKAQAFDQQHAIITEMIAKGTPARKIYDQIALLYEARHPGMRCSMLELDGEVLRHGGAPSLPEAYCLAVDGLMNGPEVGSCGTSTYTGQQVLVEDIATDPKWSALKDCALPHGMRSCWSQPIKNSEGEVLGAFGMYYNYPCLPNDDEQSDLLSAARLAGIVMERDHNLKRIRALAFTDELTGLHSRALLFQTIRSMVCEEGGGKPFGLLYIDLDNFKDINDSLGHDAGDVLLRTCADRFRSACRGSDFIARLSGDEFCVLVTDTPEQNNLRTVAQRCLELVAVPVDLEGRKITPACSIGIAMYPTDGTDLKALLKSADTALYESKYSGKNCYAFYHRSMTEKAENRFRVEHLFKRGDRAAAAFSDVSASGGA